LENHSKLLPYQLSGGLKQRVALLRTYMTGSHLLLLDEPFASLDAITRLQMQEWLLRIKEKLELTIILVTHDISEAIKLSDRIELMDKSPGRFIKTYSLSQDLKNNPTEFEMLKKEIVARL
jgi:ABC-type nitrate/sulfonate/bicarbonate transport system ATPase subunit